MIKLGELIKTKINNSDNKQQKTSLLNVNDNLVHWYRLVDKFGKFSHRLPEKVSPAFKDVELMRLWNDILDTHAKLLQEFIESIKPDINENLYKKFKTLAQIVNEFILDKFTFDIESKINNTNDTNQEDNKKQKIQSTDNKTIFIIGLHPQIQNYVNELLFDLFTLTHAENINQEQVIHKFMKLLQLTLISYTRINCNNDDNRKKEIWEKHLIPDFIKEINVVLRFTELKKKVKIGSNVLKMVYNEDRFTDEDIEKLPFYVLAQTSMFPGSKIRNYEDIFCNIIGDYIEKIRYKLLKEFFRSETQTYTYSIFLTRAYKTKNNIDKKIKQQISNYIDRLNDIINKYRFSSYKYTKEHKIIDKEFYLDLYSLYVDTIKDILTNT